MTYWAVARPGSVSGEALVLDGYVVGDDNAVVQIADSGKQLSVSEDGSQSMIWVTLGCTDAFVPAFGDQRLSRAELEAHIRRCVNEEDARRQKADIEAMTRSSSHARSAVHSTLAGSVQEQWTRIVDWLRIHFPDRTITGADRGRIHDAIAATGQSWPSELIELYTLVNGPSCGNVTGLLHRFELLTLDETLGQRESTIRIWDENACLYGGGPVSAPAEAGFQAGTFIPAFVPFAGMDSNFLCVDTRPGPMHGCVTEFDKSGGDAPGPRWVSISAMLTDLADSLTTPRAFDDGWYWSMKDGVLEWESDRTWSLRQIVLHANHRAH